MPHLHKEDKEILKNEKLSQINCSVEEIFKTREEFHKSYQDKYKLSKSNYFQGVKIWEKIREISHSPDALDKKKKSLTHLSDMMLPQRSESSVKKCPDFKFYNGTRSCTYKQKSSQNSQRNISGFNITSRDLQDLKLSPGKQSNQSDIQDQENQYYQKQRLKLMSKGQINTSPF